jgi:PAT family beta-lactamase induction signal transducer AmpG
MVKKDRSAWWWVPSLYYAEGIPYIVVMTVSVIFYKRMGISNTDIALYTSWLYLPWVIKPFWSPVVDMLRTKRFWIVIMQLFIGAGLGGVALTIPLPDFFKFTLLFFWLLAFSSATHDIAADGFYMLGLSQHQQAWFVGIRSTFYRLAMITGQGLLIILAGFIESHSGLESKEILVIAGPDIQSTGYIHPDSPSVYMADHDLKIIGIPEKLEISTTLISTSEKDSIVQNVLDWNISHGHIKIEGKYAISGKKDKTQSWWKQEFVDKFEKIVKKYFGEDKTLPSTEMSGNIGIIYFCLSRRPDRDENIIINFGRSSGDKSISLYNDSAAGSRIMFNESNWNIPAMAIIEIDPKLRTTSEASFISQSGNVPLAWSFTFICLTLLFLLFFIYHKLILPHPDSDRPALADKSKNYIKEYINTFILFFKKDKIYTVLGFLLLYRIAESQIVKLASPFLLDAQEVGGLALTTGEVGIVYGTIGLISLTIGGLLGGLLVARHGLKYWLWPMAIAINLPDVVYVYLSHVLPDNFIIINLCVAVEQFGYGFGFTAYMLYMIYVSNGEHKTAHFAITTGFMALGMMIPGMVSGYIQDLIGYQHFFIWVMVATIPSFLILKYIDIDPQFGKKKE